MRVRVDAPPDTVRSALTDADTLTEWFAESADVDLDGGRYQFWGRYTPHGDSPRQQLTSADPLRFSWELGGSASTVGIDVSADDAGSVVSVVHEGYPAAEHRAVDCF